MHCNEVLLLCELSVASSIPALKQCAVDACNMLLSRFM